MIIFKMRNVLWLCQIFRVYYIKIDIGILSVKNWSKSWGLTRLLKKATN